MKTIYISVVQAVSFIISALYNEQGVKKIPVNNY